MTDYYRSSDEAVTLTENRRTDNFLFSNELVEVTDWWGVERIRFPLQSDEIVTLTETFRVYPEVTGSVIRGWQLGPLEEITYQKVEPLATWRVIVEDWIHGNVGEGVAVVGNLESAKATVKVDLRVQAQDYDFTTSIIQEELSRKTSVEFRITPGLTKSRTTHTITVTNEDSKQARLMYVFITGWRSLATNIPAER